ncbi:MAG: FtsX-like permease family protein [Devosia sp.]
MRGIWAAIVLGLLDMRGDLRRFGLLVVCLAVGTALIAGVSSVGASIKEAVERDATTIVGGDVELSRTDRPATADELVEISRFGKVAAAIDTNVQAKSEANDAFVDLIAVGRGYPLVGKVQASGLSDGIDPSDFLGLVDGTYGALADPLLLDALGAKTGEMIELAGTMFQARGTLSRLPDSAVRGFRLGQLAMISDQGFAALSDTTSPLPGLGTYYRYKVLSGAHDPDQLRVDLSAALGDSGWTIRTPRDALGAMVRYYDLFMRFLVIVGLASLLIGGVSVWTVISAYVMERSTVIAVMRSVGASRVRIFLHFFAQVATLALIGVCIGLVVGASVGLLALPLVGQAIGVTLPPALHAQPLAVAAMVGLVTAFAFSYLPLQQALNVQPAILFRSRGLAAPALAWRGLIASVQVIPVIVSVIAFILLAIVMTGDPVLVAAFAAMSVFAVVVLRLATSLAVLALRQLPESANPVVRRALRNITGAGSNTASVVVAVGMALAMLIVVLALETNLTNEYLGASAFDVPTFVASDLFSDEAAKLRDVQAQNTDIVDFTSTPMLRGAVTAVNGRPVAGLKPRGPEALFLLSGDVPLTFRGALPTASRLVEGEWWPADYSGAPLVSLHQSLRSGLDVKIGDQLTFDIFGDTITATVANFRDYSWQGGVDFLVAFSPGVLETYPATLLGAVKAAPQREEAVERVLATTVPDVRFIAIGETLEQVTRALGQLSLAATAVGGMAVGNGLLVLLSSLATGRQQRRADALITKVLGAPETEVLSTFLLQYLLVAAFAATIATILGLLAGWVLTLALLDVDFTVNGWILLVVDAGAIAIVAVLGASTILSSRGKSPGRLLREL